MDHAFSIEVAKDYGVTVAVFLNNLAHWTLKNVGNKKHFYKNKFWTYNTQEAFTVIFPYFSRQNIRTIINNCLKKNLIEKSQEFNTRKSDKTNWYCLTEKSFSYYPTVKSAIDNHLNSLKKSTPPALESIAKNEKPWLEPTIPLVSSNQALPNINPNINKDNIKNSWSSDDDRKKFDQFWSVYPKKVAKADAIKCWKKNKLYEKADIIISDVVNRTKQDWQYRKKNHIPNPASYLNGERWHDEIIIIDPKGKNHGIKRQSNAEIHFNSCKQSLEGTKYDPKNNEDDPFRT